MFSRAALTIPPPTYKNHLRYHFEGTSEDFSPGGRMIVDVGACERVPEALIDEGARAAELIRQGTRLPLWLCLSGGVDSEAMAKCFLRAKVAFRAAILRFPNDLNEYDIKSAVSFCERERVPYEFFDFDVLDFYSRGTHMVYAKSYRCRSPQLAVHIEMMRRIPGVAVLAWNIPHVQFYRKPGEPFLRAALVMPNDHFFCYHRYVAAEQREAVPFFFAYTPELVYSTIRLPTVQKLLFDASLPQREAGLTYARKVAALNEGGFGIQARGGKYTGFEKVKKYYERTTTLGPAAYEILFRYPMEALNIPAREHVYRLSKTYIRARM